MVFGPGGAGGGVGGGPSQCRMYVASHCGMFAPHPFGQVSTQKAHVPIQPGDEVKTEPAAFQSVKTELEQSVKTELETAAAAYDCDGYELGQGSLAALDLSVFLVDEASGCSVYVKQEQAWG